MKKVCLLGLICFIIDLISKLLIINFYDDKITVISNFFYINKVTNTGAAFSMFSGYSLLFILMAVIVLLYIYKYLLKDIKTKLDIVGYSFLIGGIVGNLFDRIFYGKVIDFLSFKFGSYYFPVFNLADCFICVGVLLIVIGFIGGKDGIKSREK